MTKRKGPLPVGSRICWKASVAASRAGMMKGCGLDGTASASISSGKRAVQPKAESPVVQRRQFLGAGGQHLAHRAAAHPAAQRDDAILRPHPLAVMEFQASAQGDGAGPAVILEQMTLGHLRMGAELVVHAIERVPDHVAMVADDVGGDRDRVQPAEIGLRHEAQHPRRPAVTSAGQRRSSPPPACPSAKRAPPAIMRACMFQKMAKPGTRPVRFRREAVIDM